MKWVDDGAYGSKSKETGEWNGMLGEIIENVSVTKIIWLRAKDKNSFINKVTKNFAKLF